MNDETNPATTSYGVANSLSFRTAQTEHAVRELEKFSDELRLAKMLHEEQIRALKEQHKNVDKEISELRRSQLNVSQVINDRISHVENVLNMKFDALLLKFDALGVKFETFSGTNKTYLVGILIAVVTTMVAIMGAIAVGFIR